MRIVASACLVLAILFMVGCGMSSTDKQALTDNTTAIAKMNTDMAAAKTMMMALSAKVDSIATFLKDPKSKFGGFEVAAPTPATPAPNTKGGTTPPPAGTPPTTKTTTPKKTAPKSK